MRQTMPLCCRPMGVPDRGFREGRTPVLASIERYTVILPTFAPTILISRLLGSDEFGVSVLGSGGRSGASTRLDEAG